MSFNFEEIALLFPEVAELGDIAAYRFTEARTDEAVLAEVHSESTKILFAYVEFYSRRQAEELVKANFGETEQIREDSLLNSKRFEEQCDAMREVAFLALRTETDIWDKSLGIRKGWKVIELAPRSPQDMLRKMFGGGDD